MKIKKVAIILIIISICSLISTELVYGGIGVKPTIIETVVTTDKVIKGAYKVVNSDPETLHVTVQIEDWLEKRTGSSPISIEDWLTVTPMEFDIESQGMREVEYEINVPYGVQGELVAMVFFAAAVPTEGAFDITSRFGVSIYAAIEDGMELECDIKNITVRRNIIKKKEGGIIDRGFIFVVDIENKGNVHLRPTGVVEILGEYDDKYYVQIERGFPVYPGKQLDYAIRWDKTDLPPGRYEANVKINYGKIYDIDKRLEKGTTFFVNEDGSISE